MSGKIPASFIDDLIARSDIVDLIGSRVPLRPKGREFVALCPFHNEKTPSFTVSPEKQFYHCFGCGESGSVISFLINHDHMGFVDAVHELASRVGVEVPGEANAQEKPLLPLYQLLQEAANYYQQQLASPEGAAARAYLAERGLNTASCQRYGIGFAPPGWQPLAKALGQDAEKRQQLIETGMLIAKEGRSYDRFRNRIQFPILDSRGRVVGFGGRVIDDDTPKYLNSPESPLFHKSNMLYGLYELKKELRRVARILVVEGYMDVVMLAQFGFANCVATLGTATTVEHLRRLFSTVKEVVFCFDGDRAGRAAAWKALETSLPLLDGARQLRFLLLPEGEDPDTLVRREGAEGLTQRLEAAPTFSVFFFDHLQAQVDMDSLDGRAQLTALAQPYLRKIPAGILRDMLETRLAELAQVRRNALHLQEEHTPASVRRPSRPMALGTLSPTAIAIALLLQRPNLFSLAGNYPELASVNSQGAELLRNLLEILRSQPNLSTAALLERWRDTEQARHLQKLALWDPLISSEAMPAEFDGALQRILAQAKTIRRESLIDKEREVGLSQEEKEELRQLIHVLRS